MTQFRASEYDGRFWMVNSSDQWQIHPNENLKLLIAQSGNQESISLFLVPTDKHCPEKKILVEDVASSSFRFKLSRDVFFQWKYKGEGSAFQFKSKEVAKQVVALLEDIKTSSQQARLRGQVTSSNGDVTMRKKESEADNVSMRSSVSSKSELCDKIEADREDNNQTQSDQTGDDERPLQRINQFQPTAKRRHSQKRSDATLRRTNSRHETTTFEEGSSLVKAMEAIRQSGQRDKQDLSDKIDSLQKQVGEIFTLLSKQNQLLEELKNREPVIPVPPIFASSNTAPMPTPTPMQTHLTPTSPVSAPPSPKHVHVAAGLPPPPPPPPPLSSSSAPPPPPPPMMSGAPPPPPPPMPMKAAAASNKPKTLAEQLAEAKMKKEQNGSAHVPDSGPSPVPDPPRSRPVIDFSTELQNRIKKRTNNL